MTENELNKKIEFIIEHQAQFAADIGALREAQATQVKLLHDETQARKEQYEQLSEAVIAVVGFVGKVAEAQERADTRIAELAEAQTRTEERLNIFIDVVERHLGSNGTRPKDSE